MNVSGNGSIDALVDGAFNPYTGTIVKGAGRRERH